MSERNEDEKITPKEMIQGTAELAGASAVGGISGGLLASTALAAGVPFVIPGAALVGLTAGVGALVVGIGYLFSCRST